MKANKENQRVRLTKKVLQTSLLELLEEKPVEKISVSELCKRAEINRSTFYSHYESISDVLEEIGKEIIERIELKTHSKTNERLLTLEEQIYGMGTFFKENPKDAKLLLNYFSADSPIIQNLFLKRITSGQVNYLYSGKDLSSNAQKLLLQFFIHGIYNLIKFWILEEVEMTPKEISELAIDIATHGWIKE